MNKSNFSITKTESGRIAHKLDKSVKYGVVMVKTDVMRPCYPAALLQVVEQSTGMYLVQYFKKYQVIQVAEVSSFSPCNSYATVPNCDLSLRDASTEELWELLKTKGLNCYNVDANMARQVPLNFDILRIKFKHHLVYGFHSKRVVLLMLMV